MPANENPIFTSVPVIGVGPLTTANTNRDGTGSVASVITGAEFGTRINSIEVKASVTTTAGMVRLFIVDDAETPNFYLWYEIAITAVTVSATVGGFRYSLLLPGESALILPYGWSLKASTEKSEAMKVFARGGNF
jgi:hypothetical protein